MVNHVATTHVLHHGPALRTGPETWAAHQTPAGCRLEIMTSQEPPFKLLPLLLYQVPAAMPRAPRNTADPPRTVPGSASSAVARAGPCPVHAGRHSRAVSCAARNSATSASLRQFLMVDVFARAHRPANHNSRYGGVVVWASAPPPYASQQAAATKVVTTTIVAQPPGFFKSRKRLEAKIALPPLCLYLLCDGFAIFQRVHCG